MRTEQTNMKVVVRVRPFNTRELEQNRRSVIKVLDNTTLLFDPDDDDDEFFFHGAKQNFRDISKKVHKKLSMNFDRVFDTNINNTAIFEECTAPLVEAVLNGYNCSVFVYGATGAGKTFTMLGSEGCPGLTYLTMRDLFQKIEDQSDVKKFNVAVSYLEVYNELIINLLSKSGPLKLLEDSNGVIVSGLIPKPIFSAEELLELLAKGNANRTQHPTDANAESSRSHAVFQVHIRITDKKTDAKRTVKLSMIDLAGSERAASTKGNGTRFREGASINKSLLALGNCINNLADGLKHIPYRGSKLTRILKDSLGGNCQTLMVANVSMSALTYEDTYNTLKYASRAKKIRTTVRQNALTSNMPKDFYIKKVDELMTADQRNKETIKTLEAKVAMLQNSTSTATTTRTYDENEIKGWYRKMDAVYSNVIKVQEYIIGIQSKIKIMRCTVKFKEYAQNCFQKLALNKSLPKEDMDNFAATLAHYTKQIEKQTEEISVWREKLRDAHNDLEKLKKEIKSTKCAEILQLYQKCKDLEMKNCKEKIQINHVTNINTEFNDEMRKLRQIISITFETLESYYKNYGNSTESKANFEELQQILRSHMAKSNDGYLVSSDSDEEMQDSHAMPPPLPVLQSTVLHGKRPFSTTNDAENEDKLSYTSTAKRQRPMSMYLDFEADFALGAGLMEELEHEQLGNVENDESSNASAFKVPSASRTVDLNATMVLPSLSAADKTFDLSDNSSNGNQNARTLQKKNLYVNSLLSDKLVKPPSNKEQMKQALLKSQNLNHRGVAKTVTLGIEKENLKHSPNRIRKSPRCIAAKVFTGRTHVAKRPVPVLTPAKSSSTAASAREAPKPPVVRINRAASFRTKK